MKTILLLTLLASTLVAGPCIVNLSELNQESIHQIMDNQADVAIQCEEGTALPLHFLVSGDLLAFSGESNQIVTAKKTFYIYPKEDAILFSTDLQNWKPLMEFITGKVCVAYNYESTPPSLSVIAEINQR